MKKQQLPTPYIALIFFVYNYLASLWVEYLNHFVPSTYKIDTTNVAYFFKYIQNNWVSYVVSTVGYLFLIISLVGILVSILLFYNHAFSLKKLGSQLVRPKVYFALLLLWIFLLPLNQIGMKIPLLTYVSIPATFVSMVDMPIMLIFFWLVYISFFLILLRFKKSLYYLIVDQVHQNSFKLSWITTTHMLKEHSLTIIRTVGNFIIIPLILSSIQLLIDRFDNIAVSVFSANFLIIILTGWLYFLTAQVMGLFLSIPSKQISHVPYLANLMKPVLIILAIGVVSICASERFIPQPESSYLVVAHMGKSTKKDIPNSIECLKKAQASGADYVEIDIQKTKDGQYVLSHDSSIVSRSGRKYIISKTNWQTLKASTFDFDGHLTKATNFKDYLTMANQLNQKILVELKMNRTFDNTELKEFVSVYGKSLIQNHAQIQSLNQNIIYRLNKLTPVELGLLSATNNSIDASKLNKFYAIEFSSISPFTVKKTHQVKKKIYAWTTDNYSDIIKMKAYGVDGFITDVPTKTRKYLEENERKINYSTVIWNSVLFERTNY